MENQDNINGFLDSMDEFDSIPAEQAPSVQSVPFTPAAVWPGEEQTAPQPVTANLTAASTVTSFLYDLLVTGDLTTRYVTFSSKIISARAETVKKRKRSVKKCAA